MKPLAAIVGATGTRKTETAVAIAEQVKGEIVSCDSAQIYRGLNIGTASPTPEERTRAPHHLVDILAPHEQWSAAEFADTADEVLNDIWLRGRVPIIVGGNGLWYRALIRGIFRAPAIDSKIRRVVREEVAERGSEAMHAELSRVDPVAASRIQSKDPQRVGRALEVYRQTGVPISVLQDTHGFKSLRYAVKAVAFDWDRALLCERLARRVRAMFSEGLLEETQACLDRGYAPDAPGLSTIGYRAATAHILGKMSRVEAEESTIIATRQYAKRQRNWFRHEPEVCWFPSETRVASVIKHLHAVLAQG
ncbi:MAG: tRNA (adenosine(37)-N6)-dimethylallyltransferase MiaA [Myxococcales bacterium]|nr:tRNA (adenosine(37)-N6)-dimethylallyltransferase MiaA [Myxococcales bacterium]